MKKLALPLLLGLIVIVADQASKQWALGALADGHVIPMIGDFLSFKLAFNSGAAFSFGHSATWIFTLVSAIVSVVIPFFILRTGPAARIILGIVWGGAVGNLIDRLLRDPGFPEGHVVDFINYNGWFIGNIADIALVLGLIALFVVEIFFTETPDDEASDDDGPADDDKASDGEASDDGEPSEEATDEPADEAGDEVAAE